MAETLTPLSSIGLRNEESIARLHRALQYLGFRLDDNEISSQSAGRTTIQAVRSIERAARLPIDNRVLLSGPAAAEINRRVAAVGSTNGAGSALEVQGTVKGSDGVPIAGLTVQVFDQDLRSREFL